MKNVSVIAGLLAGFSLVAGCSTPSAEESRGATQNVEATKRDACEPGQAVSDALHPLAGPSGEHATEVQLGDLPAAVRATLEREGDAIASVTFRGTDYSASVIGYYAVTAACSNGEIVAYAVWGGGSGEPDYQDGTVVGVDLDGHVVSNESDSN